ncbi:hypothetical protein AM493_10695 [Flavobacterium akiainvivens]|uniref:Uncharacterized protein n=1 Tax=Flavobacterium akiainvivens TaxID=1202724 RepID=A0A0M9VIB2_9FLAO|nr:DUF695 domain-containing protein [Flavobacterium akiainvivens]KOS06450.1 hypothetical protein AM493_10695 [Flavobacterium akiainvivens]SFQ13244.1 Family of unknown function [Flavobacterium akiainvivens]
MKLFKLFNNKKEVATITNYADFWAWFTKHEKDFHKATNKQDNLEKAFFNKLQPHLEQIKNGIWFLVGMYDDSTAELILTAEGDATTIAFVEELVAAAPVLPGWRFTALKPEYGIDNAAVNMAGYSFNDDTVSFYANELQGYPDEIDITIVHKEYRNDNHADIAKGTFLFLDHLLGELNFMALIDNISFKSPTQAEAELVPVEKLKSFLIWREKEFVEKYSGMRHNTADDSYSVFEAALQDGTFVIATMNTTLLDWDAKASHPWIAILSLKFEGTMPDDETDGLLREIENGLDVVLKDYEGYLYLGHETNNGLREIYYACKDFRLPSKMFYDVEKKYSNRLKISADIYKDKYWKSFNRFV